MKILVNGNTIGECVLARNNNELSVLNKSIGYLKKTDKKQYIKLVSLVAMFILPQTTTVMALDYTMFDAAGKPLFELIVSVAKWVFIAKGGWEVIQKLAMGCDIGDLSSVVAKYGMGYGAMILLPKILEMIGSSVDKIGF